MKIKYIQAALLLSGISSVLVGNSYAADVAVMEYNDVGVGALKNGLHMKRKNMQNDSREPIAAVQKSAPPLKKTRTISDDFAQFIETEIGKHQLPDIDSVRHELLGYDVINNMGDWITRAIDKQDTDAVMMIGGIYYSSMDYDAAKPFIFFGAKRNDASALWLLNCLWRNKELDASKELGEYFLTKALELGSPEAKYYTEDG